MGAICRLDTPARSFILGTKGHTGYQSCIKCTQRGQYKHNKVIYPYEPHDIRTDDDFRSKACVEHHKSQSIIAIESLQIDIVKQFVLDYMHVVCLGVMKSLFASWLKVKGESFSLSSTKISLFNQNFLYLKHQIPAEFCRKPRELKEIDRFKATELRQFLLYTGPFILKDIVDEKIYHHFLKLSMGMRILLDPELYSSSNDFANQLLCEFVKDTENVYNGSLLTINFHFLTHLASEAKNFGPLDTISCFKFENYLGKIKKFVKKKHQIATQIYNRLVEESAILSMNSSLVKAKENGKLFGEYLSFVRIRNYYFSKRYPDNHFYIKGEVFKIIYIKLEENEPKIYSNKVANLCDFFEHPLKSSLLKIVSTFDLEYSETIYCHVPNDITQKAMLLSLRSLNADEVCIGEFNISKDDIQKISTAVTKSLEPLFSKLTSEIFTLQNEVKLLKKRDAAHSKQVLPQRQFTNVEDFEKFEAYLQENMDDIKILEQNFKGTSNIGGRFVKNCWRKIFTDTLAQNYCWKGTADKKGVRSLNVTLAIKNAAMKLNLEEGNFVSETKAFFQFAKNRIKQRQNYKQLYQMH